VNKDKTKAKIAAELAKKLGPGGTAREKRVQAAAKDYLAGDKMSEIEKMYAVNLQDITRVLKKAFTTDDERYEFMENCMVAGAVQALNQFDKKHSEMDAVGAAKAATMLMGRALDVKKAREAGFRETPINVGLIVSLQKTLNAIQVTPT
jgi:hypothetical protein